MFSKFKKFGSITLSGMIFFTIFSTIPYKKIRADIFKDEINAIYKDGEVVIENEYIGRVFSIADNKLKTEKIVNKRTNGGNTEFIPSEGSEEFKIRTTKDSTSIQLPSISKEGWTAEAESYQNASGPNDGPASNLIDGSNTSIWHTNYGGGKGGREYPYNVLISLNGNKKFQSFSYTPRQQGETANGNIKGYELWASTSETKLTADSDKWIKISSGNFNYDGANPIYVNLDNEVTANQLKFVAVSSNNGQNFAGGSEFSIHEEKAPNVINDREFSASNLELNGEPIISSTKATINNVEKIGKKVTFNFKPYTFKNVEYTISENIVMYEGDHFMRKYLEISVPDSQKSNAIIDYIELESMNVNTDDAIWTIPTDAGGIVEMDQFKANLGQPIYIQGMFLGAEFPVTDTQIVNGNGYIRYYSGKSFKQLGDDNQLATTDDGNAKYVTWQTVLGSARSTENEIIQADFFEYISSISTPSEFRVQYNSWFDNMMRIDDKNILDSFIEIDKELNKVEVRPLDSYVVDDGWNNYNNTSVVDSVRSGTTLNETGFWEFNSKFPEGLTPSSELVHKFGSNFGAWVGPRGGYNFYGSLADILVKNNKGSKAGGSIDVADREYVKNFGDMAVEWQEEYGVNYWKWDGFVDRAQYNAFPARDGVPGYSNRHMTGGYQNMYHVSDMWEAWIDLFEKVRSNSGDIYKLWISLTCYVNPSPWYLQWANSVWLQCTADQADAGSSSSKMDRQITYRDAAYYDFIKNHEFQFPLANIYNHDPVYGKEGTGMNINTATDEQFKNYLYMQSTRGTAFWELYYSDSIMTEGKYEITGEFLKWAEENYYMLKNAKMFGENPNTGTTLGGNRAGENYAYGFSGFDGTDGIISLRNPSTANKEISFTFDRTMGVSEDAGVLKYHLEHHYNLTDGTSTTGTLEYGKTYKITLKPDEVRILRVSKSGDTIAPKYTKAYTDGNKTITVKFNEKVVGNTFEVEGAKVTSVNKSADGITYRINIEEALKNAENININAKDIKDLSGNSLENKSITTTYYKDNIVIENNDVNVIGINKISDKERSINSNNGFTISAKVNTNKTGSVISQEGSYVLGINEDGKAYFTLNDATAVSKNIVNDNADHNITGVKENNGIIKLYVDGELSASAYNKDNKDFQVNSGATIIGNTDFVGKVGVTVFDTAYGYDVVKALSSQENVRKPLNTAGMTVSVPGTSEGSKDAIFDNDPTTFWTSSKADNGIAKGNPYLAIDLKGSYIIDRVDYTKRFYNSSSNIWKCTGNLRDYILEVSNDGGLTWTVIKSDKTFNDESYTEKGDGGTTQISFEPVKATNIRISGTSSYHWQAENVNKFMTVADLNIFGKEDDEEVVIDVKPLIDRLAELSKIDTTNATKNSVSEFNKLVKEAQDLLANIKSQTEVQNMINKLKDIERILVDTTNLKLSITDAENILNLKTKNSSKELIVKIEEAKALLNNGTVDSIKKIIEELDKAKSSENLVDRGNTSELAELIKSYEALKETDYTKESWDNYKLVLDRGIAIINDNSDSSQNDVDAVKSNLESAKDALIKAPVVELVNKEALKKSINNANNIDENIYTVTSYNAMKVIYNRAIEILNSNTVTQEQIDEVTESIDNALNSLIKRADISEAEILINNIKAENLNKDDYTEETWSKFEENLISLELAVKDNSDIDENKLNELITTLNKEKENLRKKNVNVDKTTLQNLYNLNKDKVNDRYTEESWGILQNALKNSNIIITNENATKEEVENALAELIKAIDSLRESSKEEVINEDIEEEIKKEEHIKAEDTIIDNSNKEDGKSNSDKNYLPKTGGENTIISIGFAIVFTLVGVTFIIYDKKVNKKINS